MADITMTLDEYEALRRQICNPDEDSGIEHAQQAPATRSRKKTKNDRIMARALSEANAKAKLKNGSWRKGWNQKKVMVEAHRLRRKYSK